jgi:molybdenum-dependent DNA-binding transcriptional regulator ModE
MTTIDPTLIRTAVAKYATLPARGVTQHKPRDPRTLKARIVRLAEVAQTISVPEIAGALGVTQEQAWHAVSRMASDGELVVVSGERGGRTARYRKAIDRGGKP